LADFAGFSAATTFDFQILPHIACEPHDRPMDAIVSESGIVNVLNER
jgi:5-formyltetrahydrofolate cyclo-ligase